MKRMDKNPEKKRKILFLYPTPDVVGPRSIRISHLSELLRDRYDIQIAGFRTTSRTIEIPGVEITRIEPSLFVRQFFHYAATNIRDKRPIGSKWQGRLKKRIKALFFPDPWVRDQRKIRSYFYKNHRATSPDIIIAEMGPYSTGALAISIQKLFSGRPKVIFDIGDPLCNNAARLSDKKRCRNYEEKLLKQADHIIVTNAETKDHFITDYGIASSQCTALPQGVSASMIVSNGVEADKSLHTGLHFFYAGAFYPSLRDPSAFIRAFEGMEVSDMLLTIVDRLGFLDSNPVDGRVRVFGAVEQEQLKEFYQSADVLLYFDNATGIQTPGKIYELLACQKPILFVYENPSSPAKRLLRAYKHIVYCKNNPQDISRGIHEIQTKDFDMEYEMVDFLWERRAEELDRLIGSLLED